MASGPLASWRRKIGIVGDRKLAAIRALLERPIERESEVVYFLVEVRKLIETLGRKRFQILSFFCDWVLHQEMTWKKAQIVLGIFDEFADAAKGGDRQKLVDATRKRENLISFRLFRDDLALLLHEFGLDTTIINAERFVPFLSLYVDIISRTQLVVRDKKIGLSHINSIRIFKTNTSVTRKPSMAEKFAFGVDWRLYKGESIVAGLLNEIWIPLNTILYRQDILKLADDGKGGLKQVPLEATKFTE